MIDIKTKEELAIMAEGGKILAEVLLKIFEYVKPGVSELELDSLVEKLILQKEGEPAFKKVTGYNHAICVSTNEVVVHGIPTNYKLREGDVIGIDCGVYCRGFYTDAAQTVRVQSSKFKVQSDEIGRFLDTGKKALNEAIKMTKPGNRIGHISKTIQEIVEGTGYSVVRSLVGHGVGRELHEDPEVPGFLDREVSKTPLLKEGMTLAIEVIYNMGKPDVVYTGKDGWTIKTADNSLSGLFEKTIAITKDVPLVLT